MGILTLFTLTFICKLLVPAVSLEVELILEYETMEYKNTVMECKFDTEGASLESVKWEKNGEKFFEFFRRRVSNKETIKVAGVNLDVEKSNVTHVFLKALSSESSGEYTCTVITSGSQTQSAIARENMTTVARQPTHLALATRKGFFLVTTKNYSAATGWDDARPIFSVGYHYTDGTVFYGTESGSIIHHDFYESENDSTILPTLGGALILAEEGQVTSIAVDWLRDTLYFTDDMLKNIGKINLTSEVRETLLDSTLGVSNPESIAVDPFQGYLFWGDNNERDKKIVASALDGKTNRQTIISSDLRRAILTLDLTRRRIFFIGNDGLSSCKYDGSARRVEFHHPMLDRNVNSLSYYDEFIFWSRYDTGKSSSGLFIAYIANPDVPVRELPIKSILDVKVFLPDMQKRLIQYSCDLLECSDGCVTDSSGSAHCTCPEGSTLTAGATVCTKESSENNCDKSVTTANLFRPKCKGELLFEDNFDSKDLNPDKWMHRVRISSEHEMEFVVFGDNQQNTYVKDGNLVIKPTLFDDNTVLMGNLTLDRCTNSMLSLCEKSAFSYNIIPPVKSGLINTGLTLAFRYGTVTIRAKLPRGDWVYPVLNLHATRDYYNPHYESGVIRIVDARGNEHLTCSGQEWGGRTLTSGVMVGSLLHVKQHFIRKLADKHWSDDFHIFKLTWTPDELTFSVDDQPSESIIPAGTSVRDVLGLPKENVTSKLHPFNQHMYLAIGVSVGGGLEFPDYCITRSSKHRSGEEKPWKNYEVKSMLKFWQSKTSWLQTWNDNSALLVDYVSVRAL